MTIKKNCCFLHHLRSAQYNLFLLFCLVIIILHIHVMSLKYTWQVSCKQMSTVTCLSANTVKVLIINQDNSFIKSVKLSTDRVKLDLKPHLIKRILFFFVIFVVPFTIDLKLHLVFTISVHYKLFYSVVGFHTCCTKQIYNQLQKYLR